MRDQKKDLATLWTNCEARWPESVAALIQKARMLEDVEHVAVMPDVHLARGFCVGTVLATRRLIYPSAIGSDIGCGMLALPFNASAEVIHDRIARALLGLLPALVPSRRQQAPIVELHADRPRFSSPKLDRVLDREGQIQIGTLGSGNHFLELQRDVDDGRLWLMLHSGSRGLGQAVSSFHTQRATGRSLGRPFLDAETDAGRAYLHDLAITRAYARLNRLWMARAVAVALDELTHIEADWRQAIHTDHNHVQHETVACEKRWVHRKGAAPAWAGRLSVIPGSMGTASFHVQGRGHEPSLRSSSHGAGRQMDRATARNRISTRALQRAMRDVWFDQTRSRRLTDEAPQAYKDIDQVMSLQREQVRVVRRLTPVLNYKGV